jgi:hypothetical protein
MPKMTNLTPEAVKAALGKLAIPQGKFIACDCEDDNCFHDRHNSAMNDLHFYAPDIAREYLRLKEVEKAGEALAEAAGLAGSIANDAFAAGSEEREGGSARRQGKFADRYGERVDSIRTALAAFRAAVEGK